ncbi:hypothetical protein AAVH_26011 [Aphelenchoides avenae]|nr:hypothetical protein AAVH_26011 [Aphelenchus avenae]
MLIWFQRSDDLQMYARVMRMNCLIDFAYTVISAVLFPHEEIIHGRIFFMSQTMLQSIEPVVACLAFTALYQSLLFLCLGSVCIQYIFRYFHVCRDGMSRTKFAIASTLVVFASIGHGVLGFFVFLPKSETYVANRALLATKYGTFSISSFIVADIVSNFVPLAVPAANGSGSTLETLISLSVTKPIGSMNPAWLWTFKIVNSCLAYSASFALNGLLFVLIWLQSCEDLQMYARVLRMNCAIDLVYTIVAAALFPHEEIFNGRIFLMSKAALKNADPIVACVAFTILYHNLMYLCLCSVCVQYVFRYYNVCKGGMSRTKFAIVSSVAVGLSTAHGVFAFFAYFPSIESLTDSRALLESKYETMQIPSFVVSDTSEPVALAYIIHALVTLLLVYGVMLVLGIRIHLHLKRSEQFVTKNTLRIQHCLTFVLTIQAIIPLFALVLPLVTNGVLVLLNQPDTGIPQLTMSMIAWMPAINGLSTIVLIPRYRRAALSCFGHIAAIRSSDDSGSHERT